MKELTELFTVEKVHSSPARFDMKKLEAINGDKIRALSVEDFAHWTIPFLKKAGIIQGTDEEIALVKQALPLIQERIVKLDEAPQLLKFLFVKEFAIDSDAVSKVNDESAKSILKRAQSDLEQLATWNHESIEAALRASLIEEMGLKPRIAFTALRIATTGSTISPPLFESMELLGKQACLARISQALAL
jgi:glutamyl-tRNA synthetase